MRYKDFDIKQEGKIFHIQRINYPRMSLKIDCTLPLCQIKDIVIQEECSADDIKVTLSSLEEFIKSLND